MQKLKKKKVYSKYIRRTYGKILIPEIRLEGKWLEQLGFKEGMEITICQEQNKLTITIP